MPMKWLSILNSDSGVVPLANAQRAEETTFLLTFKKMAIGRLTYQNGEWSFRYDDDYATNANCRPLLDFPSTDKVYTSTELWPFFVQRIPSKANQTKGSGNEDIVTLLELYGSRTLTNPYLLERLPLA
jgi:HipA-like protein